MNVEAHDTALSEKRFQSLNLRTPKNGYSIVNQICATAIITMIVFSDKFIALQSIVVVWSTEDRVHVHGFPIFRVFRFTVYHNTH